MTNSTNGPKRLKRLSMKTIRKFYGSVQWVWESFVPRGHVTLIVGPQGDGKTRLIAYMIAVLTGALDIWPDGTQNENEPMRVLLCDTEQMRGELADQLRTYGVKDDMVVIPGDPEQNDPTYAVDIVKDKEALQLLAEETECGALFLDSLGGGQELDENSGEMKTAMKALLDIASNLQIPVIATQLPRKKASSEHVRMTIDRVRGSSTITQFCRSLIGVYRPAEDQKSPVRGEVFKSSFCKPPNPFGFLTTNEGIKLCRAPENLGKARSTPIQAAAQQWLYDNLKEKDKSFEQLMALGKPEGITKDTLYRAREALEVVTKEHRKKKPDGSVRLVSLWHLPTVDEQLSR